MLPVPYPWWQQSLEGSRKANQKTPGGGSSPTAGALKDSTNMDRLKPPTQGVAFPPDG